MIQSTPNRRQFMATGLAVALYGLSGFKACAAALEGPIFPRPFAGSRSVSTFASGLFFGDNGVMPVALSRAIEAELTRTDIPPDSFAEERRRAGFFAWLAVRHLAPLALRRAGFSELALDCEKQSDLWNGMLASATAQHAIEKWHAAANPIPRPMVRLADFAYGTSAHAATAAFYAGHEDINVVMDTGTYCARALLEPFSYEDAKPAEAEWIWGVAVTAINIAIGIRSDDAACLDAAPGLKRCASKR
jgi:hypothetical protein